MNQRVKKYNIAEREKMDRKQNRTYGMIDTRSIYEYMLAMILIRPGDHKI